MPVGRYYCQAVFDTLRPRQNGRHFADDFLKCMFLNENVWIPIEISLKFVPKGPIDNIPALVQIMAWHRPCDNPLSEPMMVRLPTHICVTRPQWVKWLHIDGPYCHTGTAHIDSCSSAMWVWNRNIFRFSRSPPDMDKFKMMGFFVVRFVFQEITVWSVTLKYIHWIISVPYRRDYTFCKHFCRKKYMMTSSNGNIFRVTGHLCGEFTGPGEFSTQRPVTRSFDVYFDLRPNKWLSKQSWGWWFETLSCSLWRHRNEIPGYYFQHTSWRGLLPDGVEPWVDPPLAKGQ